MIRAGWAGMNPPFFFLLARLGGFEPSAYGLEVRCSILLSYRRDFSLKHPMG